MTRSAERHGGTVEYEDVYWEERAACKNHEYPNIFFPSRGEDVRPAKRICAGCDVKDKCLEHALANDEGHGIWGGLEERQRAQLRRRRWATTP